MENSLSGAPELRLPGPCLVVLIGATAAGKSRWAGEQFDGSHVVSSDRLRAVVGAGERDQRASRDAFEVLELIVAKRLARGVTTVIDSTGLDANRRAGWRTLAAKHEIPAFAGAFATLARGAVERRVTGDVPAVPIAVVVDVLEKT